MAHTLGLLEEAKQHARDLGYVVREEPLGDLAGGACTVAGIRHVLLNIEHPVVDRLERLLRILADDPASATQPRSRQLAARLDSLCGGQPSA